MRNPRKINLMVDLRRTIITTRGYHMPKGHVATNKPTACLVLLALQKSTELMDILTFIKEVNFEIKDNLGFDVLWDSMSGRQWANVSPLLLNWLGYTGTDIDNKKNFILSLIQP